MKFKLKDNREVELKEPAKHELKPTTLAVTKYITKIIKEKPEQFIAINQIPKFKDELKWVEGAVNWKKNGKLMLIAWQGKQVVGIVDATRGRWKDADKASIGISIARDFRGKGLGKRMLVEIIKLIKVRFEPKIIYLTIVEGNKNALKLYEKVGFRKIATLPKWQKARGKYWDFTFMRLN